MIEDSKVCESTDSVSLILALRYGKGVELLKAELCLSEAKRLYTSKEYSLEINKNRNKNIDSIYISSTSPNMSRRKYYIDSNNNNTDNKPKINETIRENKSKMSFLPLSVWQSEEEEENSSESQKLSFVPSETANLEKETLKKNENERKRKIIEYCESGLRYLDFTFSFYSISDSTHNSLQCYLVKADLLVMLATILDDLNGGDESSNSNNEFCYGNGKNNTNIYDTNNINNDINDSNNVNNNKDRTEVIKNKNNNFANDQINNNDNKIPKKLRESAEKCLYAALDLGSTCNIQLPLVLAGVRLIQLKIDEKRGKELITEFFTIIINRDRKTKNAVIDVNNIINMIDDDFSWMKNVPILLEAKLLL